MGPLKVSTTKTVLVGPFVSDTDGKTPETSLTINTADVLLSKNGAGLAAKNSTTATTHSGNGFYLVSLNTVDTGTHGRLVLSVKVAGALSVWHEFDVIPATIYDVLVDGIETAGKGIPCDVRAINGTRSDNGTAVLSVKQIAAVGDSTTRGLIVGGVAIAANNSTTPAVAITGSGSGTEPTVSIASSSESAALKLSSIGTGSPLEIIAEGQGVAAVEVFGGPAAAAIYAKGGNSTASANGGAGLSLKGGTGSTTTGRRGGDGLFAEGSSENGGDGIRARSESGPGVGVKIIGDDGVGLDIDGATDGVKVHGGDNGATIVGDDYGLTIEGTVGKGVRVKAPNTAGGAVGIEVISGGIGIDVMADGLTGAAVSLRGSQSGPALDISTYKETETAVNVYSDTGTAIKVETNHSTIAGPGDIHAVEILAPEHGGVLVKSDAEALTLESLRNAAAFFLSNGDSALILENTAPSIAAAVKIMGRSGVSIEGTQHGNHANFAGAYGVDILGGVKVYGGTSLVGAPGDAGLEIQKGAGAAWDFTADSISPILSALNGKLPAGLIASQSDVQSIINNTTFVSTIPETAVKPETGSTGYKIRALVYDTAGNMEATDNGVSLRLTSMTNASLNGRLFNDAALSIPADASGTYTGFAQMTEVSGETGVFEIWYKSSATDFDGPVLADFKYRENGVDILHNRMTTVASSVPGESVLSNSAANKEIIAAAVRSYIPTATIAAGSIEHSIKAAIEEVGLDVDATLAKVNEVDGDLSLVAIEVAKIVGKLPAGGALISGLSMATATAEGTTLEESVDLVRAALRGKMTLDGNTLTFYKKDGATPLFRVIVTTTDRTPI